jgi:alanine racemase
MRNAWIEIDLAHLAFNLNSLKKAAGSAELIGIVKADAYGHGAVRVAELLIKHGVRYLAVADLTEALRLREAGITNPIITLSAPARGYEEIQIKQGLVPLISCLSDVMSLSAAAEKIQRRVDICLAVDTGMGREGFLCSDETLEVFKRIFEMPYRSVVALLSHVATADDHDLKYSVEQLKQFNGFIAELALAGYTIPPLTMANSAAMIRLPESRFDMVRPGIALYGQYPFSNPTSPKYSGFTQQAISPLLLKPVMSVRAKISLIKKVDAGFSISYGATFTTKHESTIGLIPIGYADGLPLCLTNKGHVIVRAQLAPIVGRVCMDMCLVDLTDVHGVNEYDEAIVLGSDGNKEITATDLANQANSSAYEVLCRFGQRLPKVYING